jgi:hypothetical protein
VSRRGRPSEHICSRWELKPVSTHSSTSMKPHWSGISARPKTWPLYSTGGSQSPHPLTQDRCRGFAAFRQRFMIITYGASTWRSGRSS